jgi:aminopeptidase N
MSNPFRWICIGVGTLIVGGMIAGDHQVRAQSSAPTAPARRPFAKPETQRKAERLRFVDVQHVKAELTLDTKKREVRGTVTHTVRPLHPFLKTVDLDCGSSLDIKRITLSPGKIPCTFRRNGDNLTIALDKPHGPDETLDLAIEYAGSPDRGIRFILPDPAYPEKPLAIWTQGEAEDTHHWLPCYDYPNDRATSEMIVTVEKPLSVLSNGVLVSMRPGPGNTRVFYWKMEVPFVSYLISLAVADFSVYHDKAGDLPVDYYVARGVDEPTARRFMGKTPRMIEFFGKMTGQPYPYAKYAQVCVPEFGGGMENITATTMTDQVLHDEIAELEENADGLVSHELAHQWFGDLLTCKDWSHLWLNEGFASYFGPLFTEHDRGEDAFRIEMNQELQGYLTSDRDCRRPIVEQRYEASDDMFDAMTYNKGACVLHALRGLLGDEVWWKGIRRYVADHQRQVVETDDFRKAMEAASGKSLKWFFDQWVEKAGHPELKVRWRYEDEDKTVRIRIEQTQKVDEQTPLFRLPTTLEIAEEPERVRTIPIVIDGASQEFIIPVAVRPRMVQVDPQGWLIKQLDFEKSDAENLYQLEHASCVLGRLDAARTLAGKSQGRFGISRALAGAWKREKNPSARRQIVELIGNGDATFRAALIEATKDPEARVRVAAIAGLARLKRDQTSESILRAAWNNSKEAYGARRAALRGLAVWKVDDAPKLLEAALKIPADRHTIAATALQILLENPDSRARELAALYSRYGQPTALRTTALGAFSRIGKDDPALQDILVNLIEDPDTSVRFQIMGAVRDLKIARAVPALRARLARESSGFSAFTRRRLQETIEALQGPSSTSGTGGLADGAKSVADLEAQAAELEVKARDLRGRIAALKQTPAAGPTDSASKGPAAGTGTSN